MTWPGEHQAWDILTALDPGGVSARAGVVFHAPHASYKLTCLGQGITVLFQTREITGNSPAGQFLVNELGGYARLSILRYLIQVKDVTLSGRLVRPSDLPGGDIFSRGTHVLPLGKIAERFGNNLRELMDMGKMLGGSQCEYGDASVELFPFPRVPVVIIVWSGDKEFPPRASLLFDSSCTSHLSTDVIWSTAMMTLEMMLTCTVKNNAGF